MHITFFLFEILCSLLLKRELTK